MGPQRGNFLRKLWLQILCTWILLDIMPASSLLFSVILIMLNCFSFAAWKSPQAIPTTWGDSRDFWQQCVDGMTKQSSTLRGQLLNFLVCLRGDKAAAKEL